jgi:hypothetical protein
MEIKTRQKNYKYKQTCIQGGAPPQCPAPKTQCPYGHVLIQAIALVHCTTLKLLKGIPHSCTRGADLLHLSLYEARF